MAEARIEDAAESVQDAADAVSDASKDNVRHFQARAQEVKAAVNEAIGKAADSVAAAAVKVGDQAKGVYGATTDRVQKAADVVDPFVKEQPYFALALAGAAGLLLGLLAGGRGPKVIYVKTRT